ncbi:MAG: FG-GAP repeat protein [Anaerolineales bacterium]|nr:FG-GAP repeat protein [Anaerolineales bacterium]
MKALLAFLLGLGLVGLVMSLAQVHAAQPVPPKMASLATLLPSAQAAKLTASDGVGGDNLGYSVAASGDTFVVGAFGDDSSRGTAYVFVEPGGGWSGALTQTAKLVASDGVTGDLFGFAVAITGDTIVVGAVGDNSSRGSAYVFAKPGSGWSGTLTETAKLTTADGTGGDTFAATVALNGDTLAAGAPADTIGSHSRQGSVYIFVKPSGGWVSTSTFTAKLTASDGITDDIFGGSVALSGDTLVAGAPGYFSEPGPDAAYVFVKPGSGWVTTSTFAAKLTASDGVGTDVFGFSAAISGDTVVIGASDDDSRKGSTYIFVKPGGSWSGSLTETAKLTAADGTAEDRFGLSVTVISDTVMTGAPGDDSGRGSAYLFAKPGGGWVTTATFAAKLTVSDGAADNFFGFSLAASDETVVIGAQGHAGARGSAYVFSRPFLYLPLILR